MLKAWFCAIQQLLRIVPYISKKLVTVANCKKKKKAVFLIILKHGKTKENKLCNMCFRN